MTDQPSEPSAFGALQLSFLGVGVVFWCVWSAVSIGVVASIVSSVGDSLAEVTWTSYFDHLPSVALVVAALMMTALVMLVSGGLGGVVASRIGLVVPAWWVPSLMAAVFLTPLSAPMWRGVDAVFLLGGIGDRLVAMGITVFVLFVPMLIGQAIGVRLYRGKAARAVGRAGDF